MGLVLAGLFVCSFGGMAADLDPAAAAAEAEAVTTPSPAGAPPAEQPKQCYSGCQSWGQMCNVDPRGVYKCQRRCEKFGEICE
jgi:hypothetical protein